MIFFTDPVPAATARQVGTGLVREAIAMRGRMDLRCYDRLFPSQDLLLGPRPRKPHRSTAARPVPPARHDGVPRPEHPRAL